MSVAIFADWAVANQRYLAAALAVVRGAVEDHVARASGRAGASSAEADRDRLEAVARELPAPAGLERLVAAFGLSAFERDLLLLCAGPELDAAFGPLCAQAQGDPSRAYPTFGLALAALSEPHWSAITPAAPLRYWRLIEVCPGPSLAASPLRIDERGLHELAGAAQLDERLVGLVEPLEADEPAPPHRALAERVAADWPAADGRWPLVELRGAGPAARRAVAAAAARARGLLPWALPAAVVPTAPPELETLLRLWSREAALGPLALLVECDEADLADPARAAALARLVERLDGPLLVSSAEGQGALRRPSLAYDVAPPLAQLWEPARKPRPRLGGLAQRIEPAAGWDDLVLPAAQLTTLRDVAVHVRQRATVYGRWGFAARGERGLGITALFAGPSGTGKTMAAEVLARELGLDLYRVDLAAVVSKYIGETEKNLRQVFDAVEAGGAILLFDEADALFGKRSEVRDSHDRYANVEVSYLLQRMEAYRGLAILTTNFKQALDPAFLRRLRFVVQFPFPDAAQRAEIWRRVFPSETPTDGLDPLRLARLSIAGGNIRNIALYAAFLAADEGAPVGMPHLLRAARVEYAKLEKPLGEAELRGVAAVRPNVDLRIDELVLDGFEPAERGRIAAAVERELARLLAERGLPPSLAAGGAVPRLDGGAFDLPPGADPDAAGRQVAGAVYRSLGR